MVRKWTCEQTKSDYLGQRNRVRIDIPHTTAHVFCACDDYTNARIIYATKRVYCQPFRLAQWVKHDFINIGGMGSNPTFGDFFFFFIQKILSGPLLSLTGSMDNGNPGG